MALVSSFYEPYIGTRAKSGQNQVEYFNKQNGQAFGDPNQLFGYAATLSGQSVGDFNHIQSYTGPTAAPNTTFPGATTGATPATTPVTATVSPVASSSAITGTQTSQLDIQKLVQENLAKQQKLFEDFQTATQTSPDLAAANAAFSTAQTNLTGVNNEVDQFNQSYKAGSIGLDSQVSNVPAQIVAGQQRQLAQQQELGAQSLGIKQNNAQNAVQNALSVIQNINSTQTQKLNALKVALDVNQDNITNTVALYEKLAPQNLKTSVDENGNVSVITQNPVTGQVSVQQVGNQNVTSPFYKFDNGQTVYTRDGRALTSKAEYLAAGGNGNWTDVQTVLAPGSQPQPTVAASGSRSSGGSSSRSVGSGIAPVESGDATVQAIMENPALYSTLTPSKRQTLLPQLLAAGFNLDELTAKPVNTSELKELTQFDSAISNLAALRETIAANQQYLGPVSGLQRFNPWSKARQVQADVDRVKQQIGKTLEGGVLRKEDEEKYKKILATLTDVPETALYKLDQLATQIQRDRSAYAQALQDNGRRINGSAQTNTKATDLRSKYNY